MPNKNICKDVLTKLDSGIGCSNIKCKNYHTPKEHITCPEIFKTLYETCYDNNMNITYDQFVEWLELRNFNRMQIIEDNYSKSFYLERQNHRNNALTMQALLDKIKKEKPYLQACSIRQFYLLNEEYWKIKDEEKQRKQLIEYIAQIQAKKDQISKEKIIYETKIKEITETISELDKNIDDYKNMMYTEEQWMKIAYKAYKGFPSGQLSDKIIKSQVYDPVKFSTSHCCIRRRKLFEIKHVIKCDEFDRLVYFTEKTYTNILIPNKIRELRKTLGSSIIEGIISFLNIEGNTLITRYYNHTLQTLANKLDYDERKQLLPIILLKLAKAVALINNKNYSHNNIRSQTIRINYLRLFPIEAVLDDLDNMTKTCTTKIKQPEDHSITITNDIYALGTAMLEFLSGSKSMDVSQIDNTYPLYELLMKMVNPILSERATAKDIIDELSY